MEDDCSDLIALPCGHLLCKGDYQRLGGYVRSGVLERGGEGSDESSESVILNIRSAGVGGVNGTYRFCIVSNKYTRLGFYKGNDAEFSVESRVVDGKKLWFISVEQEGKERVDLYKAKVEQSSNYPSGVTWHQAHLLEGLRPMPKIAISYFE